MKNCAPGTEFVFKRRNGQVLGKAKNLHELVHMIKNAPLDSVLFHAREQHFVPWLAMIGEDNLAAKVKALKVDENTVRADLARILKA